MCRIVAIATYRGCFDGFSSVVDLTDGYLGCRTQTWNNKRRQWCLCNTDLCNVHFDLKPPPPPPPPPSPSQHQRQPPPSVAHGNEGPPSSFRHQMSSKHPVRPSQDPRNEFFESFADKARYRQSAADAPSDGLVFPVDYVQPRSKEVSDGRNFTNYNEARPRDHFKEQDDHDVPVEEPIAFSRVQDEKSHRILSIPGQLEKVTEKKLKDNGPTKDIAQITYDADVMSFELLDYPYNQEMHGSKTVGRQVSGLEGLDDLGQGRKLGSVQADGPDSLLKNNDSKAMKVDNGIRGTDKEKGLRTETQRDLENSRKDEELDNVFTEDAIDPELSEDYPYNQIFNQELAKEDLELLTKPRLFELRFSQTPKSPSSDSAQKSKSAKSTLEVNNNNSKEKGWEHPTRLKVSAVRTKEFPSINELIRPDNLNQEGQNRPPPGEGEEMDGFDARTRLAIHDADILWVGQDRAADDANPGYFFSPENSEYKKTILERDPVESGLEKRTPHQHHKKLEKRNDQEEQETRSGKEADIVEAQISAQGEELKNFEKIDVDRRTGIPKKQNKKEEFSSKENEVEQTTLKAGMDCSP